MTTGWARRWRSRAPRRARRSAGRRDRRLRRRGSSAAAATRRSPPRSDRACGDRRAARGGRSARQLPAARLRALRDARAVRDVRRRDAPCAARAPRLRRARSEDGRVRIGDRSLRRAAAQSPTRVTGGVAADGVRRAVAQFFAAAAPAGGRMLSRRMAVHDLRAGGLRDRPARRVDRAVTRLERSVIASVAIRLRAARWQRFAAPDDERLAAIARVAADPTVTSH